MTHTTAEVQHPLEGILDILREAVEGGAAGEGTAFLDGTKADGSGNHGLLATLDSLSAEEASRDIYGTSIAGQARHTAFHMEVMVRWEQGGERGPFDWKGSFLPAEVTPDEWQALRARVREAYTGLVLFVRTQKEKPLDGDMAGGLAGAAAHVAYHLGAMRQMLKVAESLGTGR